MIKKLSLATALSALLLSGCGGGSDSSNDISDKKYVVIIQDVEAGICESSQFRDELISEGFESLLTEETARSTTCGTYGKINDGIECGIEFVGTGNVNCVVGVNSINGQGKQAKVSGNINLYDILETTVNENF